LKTSARLNGTNKYTAGVILLRNFDKETGTIYLRARYYNPAVGRFISEDSVWGKDTDPLSLNLYTYCENDPVNQIDPSGHEGLPYEPNKTNKNPAILNTTNCYAYSMNLKCYPDGTPFDSHKYLLNINIWGHGIRIENGGINP
jgi:RHS repeat-associated protein